MITNQNRRCPEMGGGGFVLGTTAQISRMKRRCVIQPRFIGSLAA